MQDPIHSYKNCTTEAKLSCTLYEGIRKPFSATEHLTLKREVTTTIKTALKNQRFLRPKTVYTSRERSQLAQGLKTKLF